MQDKDQIIQPSIELQQDLRWISRGLFSHLVSREMKSQSYLKGQLHLHHKLKEDMATNLLR